jgi:hypothetical protein
MAGKNPNSAFRDPWYMFIFRPLHPPEPPEPHLVARDVVMVSLSTHSAILIDTILFELSKLPENSGKMSQNKSHKMTDILSAFVFQRSSLT